MSRSLRNNLLFVALLALLVFVVTDCSTGKTRYCPGTVRQHVYNPPYTSTSTGSNGQATTDYHSAEYHLLVECQQPGHAVSVSVRMDQYVLIRDGQAVTVGERVGRYSKTIWVKWIENTHTATAAY